MRTKSIAMADNMYDTIVVGGGISGILATLALSKEGEDVLLLEKNSVLGGNCRTYEPKGYKGWRVDTGVHAITELSSGPLIELGRYFEPGMFPRFVKHDYYYLRERDGLKMFPSTLQGFLGTDVLPAREKMLLAGELISAMASRALFKTGERPVSDTMSKHGFSKKSMQFVDALSYLLTGLSMEKTSVSRFLDGCGFGRNEKGLKERVRDFSSLFNNKGYHEQGYPIGGIQSITDGAVKSFPENAEYHLNEGVCGIKKEDGKSYVSTKENEYSAKRVVYSGKVKNLPDIIEMPQPWTEQVSMLDEATALTIWFGSEKPIETLKYRGSEVFYDVKDGDKELFYWLMPVSEFDSSLVPNGKSLVGASTAIDPRRPKEYEEKLLNTLYSVIPGLERNSEVIEVQVMSPEKAAVSIKPFPSVKTPIEDLYVVGTDTDMRSMGITRASYSVIELLKHLDMYDCNL